MDVDFGIKNEMCGSIVAFETKALRAEERVCDGVTAS